jgi:hypothetical protein
VTSELPVSVTLQQAPAPRVADSAIKNLILARIEQRPHHVTADISGAARHQNRHVPHPCFRFYKQGHQAPVFLSNFLIEWPFKDL